MNKIKNRNKKDEQNLASNIEQTEETKSETPDSDEAAAIEAEVSGTVTEDNPEVPDTAETAETVEVEEETEKVEPAIKEAEVPDSTEKEKQPAAGEIPVAEEVVIDADECANVKICAEEELSDALNAEAKAKEEAVPAKPVFDGIDRDGMTDEEYIAALETKLGQTIADAAMCKNLAQRLQADFDNYRKRNNSLAEEMKKIGSALVIEKLLSVLDNCGLARKYISDESALQGFNMMETQILSALDAFGLKEIEAQDKPFDAKFMTAVEKVSAKNKTDIVIEVTAKGYTLDGKLLRPAAVKIGK